MSKAKEVIYAYAAAFDDRRHSHSVETLTQAIAYFTTVGMPARNLSARTRVEYQNDLADLAAYH